jgi:transcriptional regulator with XRE-family HTH domain
MKELLHRAFHSGSRVKKDSPVRRRRSEAEEFRRALLELRAEKEWNQAQLAAILGVSKRTLSNWECGYWLPPAKQRLHVVLALRDTPPEYVLGIADALGVSQDPAVAKFLQPFEDELDGVTPAPPPPPPVLPPPRVPPDPVHLRRAFDAAIRDAADAMNVPANDLRTAVVRALALGKELGATIDEIQEALAVKGEPTRPK